MRWLVGSLLIAAAALFAIVLENLQTVDPNEAGEFLKGVLECPRAGKLVAQVDPDSNGPRQ